MRPAAAWISALGCLLCAACTTDNNDPDQSATTALSQRDSRPNVLLIVADDLAYTDLGSFGGEIATPNLDALAASGILFTNFHSAPTCAPARAMLLTGTDNHTAGVGSMFGPTLLSGIEGRVGYEGFLSRTVATLPEMLAENGYHTYMAGKWHLGSAQDQRPDARGFERSFSLLTGSGDHFSIAPGEYVEDGELLAATPTDFYSTRTYTDRLIDYIGSNLDDGRPFFAYAAYTAPHWPLQAPAEFIGRYAGRYDAGFDAVRSERLRRARALRAVPDVDAPLPAWLGPTWDALGADERAASARKMEIYAAMVENLDFHVGRLVEYLEQTDQLDNTVILFLSDNGAESDEMERNPTFVARIRRQGSDNSLENLGHPGSWTSYGAGWAQAGMAPFRQFKGFTTEGGTRVPAFLAWRAAGIEPTSDNQYLRVADIAPTVLETTGASVPDGAFRGRTIAPIEGRSFAGVIRGDIQSVYTTTDPIGMELHGHRSLQRGPYKLVWEQAPGNTWWGYPVPEQWHRWQLFRIDRDPGETNDLSENQPDLAAELARQWEAYADDHGVAQDVRVIDFERWHPAAADNSN